MWHARSAVLALLVTVGGCASGPSPETSLEPSSETSASSIRLTIESHNWADVVIYLEHEGQRSRLGLAKAASVTAMRIPASWAGSTQTVRLVAHRVGSRTDFRSEGFIVLSEQEVVWTLETDLQGSSLTLR